MAPWTLQVRVDGYPELGYGHYTRTVAVAHALRAIKSDIDIRFYLNNRSDPGPVRDAGYSFGRVPDFDVADWFATLDPAAGPLLLDSYRTDESHLRALVDAGFSLVVLDTDCRLQRYDAHLIVDSSPAALNQNYNGRPDSVFLLGPSYFPLNPAVAAAITDRDAPDTARRLMISLGGSDPRDATARILDALPELTGWRRVDVALGPGYGGSVLEREEGTLRIRRTPEDYVDMMASADLAICAGGQTAFEFAALGVPTLTLAMGADQPANVAALEDAKCTVSLGSFEDFDPAWLRTALAEIQPDAALRAMLGRNGRQLIDGRGASRIAEEIVFLWERPTLVDE